MTKNKVKDVFGTEIEKGHIVIITKGTRGFSSFQLGIVTDLIETPKQYWVETVLSSNGYSNNVVYDYCSKHMMD